jgi:hypothetical protein
MNQLILPTVDELNSYKIVAQVASHNPHWRKLANDTSPGGAACILLSIMLFAREIGMSPMTAISGGIYFVKGKFEISARGMNMLIRQKGHQIKIIESTDTLCKIWSKRKDTGEEHNASYHIEEASRAGLIKEGGGWRTCPKDMLFARALSRLARQLYPDCISGGYIEGELQESMLKEVVNAPSIPTEFELQETAVPELALTLDDISVPEDIDFTSLQIYVDEMAKICDKTSHYILKNAKKRSDSFFDSYRKWLANQQEKFDI